MSIATDLAEQILHCQGVEIVSPGCANVQRAITMENLAVELAEIVLSEDACPVE